MIDISINFDLFNNYYYFYERLLVLLFSLVPSFLLVGFVLYTDRKSKEPTKNIIICLLSGILSVSLAGYLEQLALPFFSNDVILIYVFAGIEELTKMLIFFLLIFDNKHYDDIYDGLVYMMLIALSFAGLENIMYAFSESTISNSISLALLRDFTTIPLHVICGIVIGYFASLGTFSKDRTKKYTNFFLGILIALIIHGTFNLLMSFLGGITDGLDSNIKIIILQVLPLVIIMMALFVIAIKYSKKALELDKIFVNNGEYDSKYNYLMTYDEYIDSYDRRKRVNLYNKISIRKEKEIDFVDISEEDTNA